MNSIPPFAAAALAAWLRPITATTPAETLGPEGELDRWVLHRHPDAGGVYLHLTNRSDGDLLRHCHPYDNVTLVLEGEIREDTPEGIRTLVAGDVVVRAAPDMHRLEVDAPALTLFMIGPRVREWGFHGPHGFIPSQEHFRNRWNG